MTTENTSHYQKDSHTILKPQYTRKTLNRTKTVYFRSDGARYIVNFNNGAYETFSNESPIRTDQLHEDIHVDETITTGSLGNRGDGDLTGIVVHNDKDS